MPSLTASPKIDQFLQSRLTTQWPKLVDQLIDGALHTVEDAVHALCNRLHDQLMTHLLNTAAPVINEQHRQEYTNLDQRDQRIVLRTGHQVKVEGCYRKRLPVAESAAERHLLAQHFGLIRNASPSLYGRLAQAAVISPSYDQAAALAQDFGINCSVSGVQRLTNTVAATCRHTDEIKLLVNDDDHLAGKRVIISSDGGRSRLREYTGEVTEQGRACFDTPYREPKLFVIEVLNDEGRQSQHHLPIYGCRFDKDEHVDLLRRCLKRLGIEQAAEVQLICDGAPWIWNALPAMLDQLGVSADKLTLTLDYYHAMQHLHKLCEYLPRRIGKKHRARLLARSKNWLWEGKIRGVIRWFAKLYRRIPAKIITELNYFNRHGERMDYADYASRNLLCGSGLVESAIRRVINLRFKSSSTFWLKDNVESMYFIRGAVLSKRWNSVVKNLAQRQNLVGQN